MPEFMTAAPAAAPHKNTSPSARTAARRGSHPRTSDVRSNRLVVIGCQRDQHVVLALTGCKRWRLLLCHDPLRCWTGEVGGFPRNQVAAQYSQGQQTRENQPAAEGKVQAEQAANRRRGLILLDLSHDPSVKTGRRDQRFFCPQGAEPLRYFPHAADLAAARVAASKVSLDFSLSRRIQRSGQKLFK